MSYNNYLQSSHWKQTRENKLQSKSACQVCLSDKNLNIHHKRYQHRGESILGKETNGSLVTLCSSCHKLTHHYFGIEVKKLNKKYCRVRRLLELGATKNKAFWVISQPDELFYGVRDRFL